MSHFSIYTKSRPIRLAFLANPDKLCDEQFDTVVEYNFNRWGGRFNPVIFTDGITINKDWWRFLVGFDPDIVISLVNLSEELTDRINSFVAPLEIEVCEESDSSAGFRIPTLFKEGLRVYPSPENLISLSRAIPILEETTFVTFVAGKDPSPLIMRFISRNFGIYDNTIFTEAMLKKVEGRHLQFRVTDTSSLKIAIAEISSQPRRVYPLQLSSFPRDYPWVSNPNGEVLRDAFTVVIGDSWHDIIHFWNHPLTLQELNRTGTSEIWLPVELAKHPELKEVFPQWFDRLAGYLTQHGSPIHFVSRSLSEGELREIAQNLIQDNHHFRVECKSLVHPQIPHFVPGPLRLELERDPDMHSVMGDKVAVPIDVPGSKDGVLNEGHWMADVYIQYRPELFRNFLGREFWWQFPKQNRTIEQVFTGRPSRVNLRRFPSVLMYSGRSVRHLNRDHYLRINLPDEHSLFRTLLIRDRWLTRELSRIDDAFHSEKGRYLMGVLELFSGLFQAYSVLSLKYWQILFKELSRNDSSTPEASQNKIRKILRKHDRNDHITEETHIQNIIDLAKNWFQAGRDLRYEDFVNKANKIGEDIEWLNIQGHVSDFVAANVLRVGLRPKCTRCGYRTWYHINEVGQTNECKGCGTKFALHPNDHTWYYKLNSLVQVGLAEHGLLPVILTLGQLLNESESSFIFTASLDLFKEDNKKGDLDIVCIRDGKLVIGEVKQSAPLYQQRDFDKMVEFAKEIKPDEVIFSALYADKKSFLEESVLKIDNDLKSFGINVRAMFLETFDGVQTMNMIHEAKELLSKMTRAEKASLLQTLVRDLGDAFPGIESTPDVCHGAACIVRTEVSVWALERARRLGTSEADLLRDYPDLRAEDLANAWAYFRSHREEIEEAIKQNEED